MILEVLIFGVGLFAILFGLYQLVRHISNNNRPAILWLVIGVIVLIAGKNLLQ